MRFVAILIAGLMGFGCGGTSATDTAPVDDVQTDVHDGADTAAPEVDTAAVDTGPAVTVRPIYNTKPAAGFYELPFPNDIRRKPGCGLDLSDFPNTTDVGLLDDYAAVAGEVACGFSNNAGMYVQFDGLVDAGSLPTPAQSMGADAALYVVNLTAGSDRYGQRVAVWSRFNQAAGIYYPENMLIVQPVLGLPLEANGVYGLVVTTALRGFSGGGVAPAEAFVRVLSNEGATEREQQLAQTLAPLREYLQSSAIGLDTIAVASVFTVQDPADELRRIRHFVVNELSPPQIAEVSLTEQEVTYYLYEGIYLSPNFQSGEVPYNTGGHFEWDAEGKPIVQRMEQLRFALVVPRKGEEPPGGWPIAMNSQGTGSDYLSFLEGNQKYGPGVQCARMGIAGISIDQPMHGVRKEGKSFDDYLASFNFINPHAGRTNFRQSVIDSIVMTHALRNNGFTIPAAVSHTGQPITFDPSRILFIGHSHGGIAGAMLMAVEPDILGAVIAGAGGGLAQTLLERSDLEAIGVDISKIIRAALEIPEGSAELDTMHPAVMLIQTLVDVTDPINYAPYYRNPAVGGPRNILLTEGLLDKQNPPGTTENLASAGQVPQIGEVFQVAEGLALQGINSLPLPVSLNYVSDSGAVATAGLCQDPDSDHQGAFESGLLAMRWTTFIRSLVETGVATIE